jgi:uncharacterized protein (DUF1778 family)
MRVAVINLRASPEQRDLIDRAASLLGDSRSDFILEAACERAQSVLLDTPLPTNGGLERLMAVKPPWDSNPG